MDYFTQKIVTMRCSNLCFPKFKSMFLSFFDNCFLIIVIKVLNLQ